MSRLFLRFKHLNWVIVLLVAIAALTLRGRDSAHAMNVAGLGDDVSVTSVSVTGATPIFLPGSGHATVIATWTATTNAVIHPGNWFGQHLELFVCQDGTGGWTPVIGHTVGVFFHGNFPTFTTTPNKCDIVGLVYTSLNQWYITGSIQNE